MRKKVLGSLCLIILVVELVAAQANLDSLKEVVIPLVESEVDRQLDWLEKVGLGSVLAISLYGLYLWFVGIRKKAEKVLEEKIEDQIKEKLSLVTGAKVETISAYFRQYEQDITNKAAAQIYMLSKKGVDITSIQDNLKKNGYGNFSSLRLDEVLPNKLPAGAIVILNNSLPREKQNSNRERVTDEEFDNYVSSFVNDVKLVYFGVGRYSGEYEYRMRNFANTETTLPDALLKVVRT